MTKTIKHIYLNDFGHKKQLNVPLLPGGEFHPTIPERIFLNTDSVCIHTRIHNGDDLMKLFTVTDAVRRGGVKNISVFMPYIPGGRQDREHRLEAFTLKMYANMINSQNYENVFTIDPHSDVTTALINNCKPYPMFNIMKQVLARYDTILIPDAGAGKKVYDYYLKGIPNEFNIIQCLKKRDTKTGKLSGFEVCIKDDWQGRLGDTIILDDICDGGGTFLGLAAEILERYQPFNLDKLALYVTHGIFSKGFDTLFEKFDAIYTTTSWNSRDEYNKRFVLKPGNEDFGLPNEPVYNSNRNKFHVIGI